MYPNNRHNDDLINVDSIILILCVCPVKGAAKLAAPLVVPICEIKNTPLNMTLCLGFYTTAGKLFFSYVLGENLRKLSYLRQGEILNHVMFANSFFKMN